MTVSLTLRQLQERYALTQLPADSQHPSWLRGRFAAVLRSSDEVTVVAEEWSVPAGLPTKGGFCCLEIVGSFGLDSVGIVAAATRPIAEAGISLFVYSTWSTDFILVAEDDLDRAKFALNAAGHVVQMTTPE
jgi:hypothetical protein